MAELNAETNETVDTVSNSPAEIQNTQEVKEWQAPESEDALNVLMNASANKAKTEILKDLGVKSIKDFKESKTLFEAKQEEFNTISTERDQFSSKYDSAVKELDGLKEAVTLDKLNISDEYKEDLLKLAKPQVSDDKSLEDILSDMVTTKYKYATTTPGKFKVGIEKSNEVQNVANEHLAMTKL